ncbi:hypothetical protein HDU76_008376 [Blyttiomyces sp. JEL0837]|nr:hypothetical protein HDU76_008376 [Blyttiomyces sp. JEL0837]
MLPWFMVDVKEGVLTQLYLATSPEIETKKIQGQYFIPTAKQLKLERLFVGTPGLDDDLMKWTEAKMAEINASKIDQREE